MKKGFTLIELMGVLILLAIISLIAVPVVLNLINDSREEAKKRSLDNYIHAVNLAISSYNSKLEHEEIDDMTCNIQSDGNLDCNGTIINVNVKNTKPASGIIVIKDYEVSDYYGVSIDSKAFNSVEFNGTKVAATQTDTHKGIVYLDPTDLSATCNATLASQNLNENNTPTGIKTGCMKFYIYDDTGDSYKMILDHNTSGNVSWATCEETIELGADPRCRQTSWGTKNTYGPIAVTKRLHSDTTGWIGTPRLISIDEIAHIVGVDIAIGWDSTDSTNSNPFYFDGSGSTYEGWQMNWDTYNFDAGESKHSWLFNNTYDCVTFGCAVEDNNLYPCTDGQDNWMCETYGYWTSSADIRYDTDAWGVSRNYISGTDYDLTSPEYGVRPVITLPKTIIDGN